MKITVEFHCHECGLLTPGFAELPEGIHPRTAVNLGHTCFHCGALMEMQALAGRLLRTSDLFTGHEDSPDVV